MGLSWFQAKGKGESAVKTDSPVGFFLVYRDGTGWILEHTAEGKTTRSGPFRNRIDALEAAQEKVSTGVRGDRPEIPGMS